MTVNPMARGVHTIIHCGPCVKNDQLVIINTDESPWMLPPEEKHICYPPVRPGKSTGVYSNQLVVFHTRGVESD